MLRTWWRYANSLIINNGGRLQIRLARFDSGSRLQIKHLDASDIRGVFVSGLEIPKELESLALLPLDGQVQTASPVMLAHLVASRGHTDQGETLVALKVG